MTSNPLQAQNKPAPELSRTKATENLVEEDLYENSADVESAAKADNRVPMSVDAGVEDLYTIAEMDASAQLTGGVSQSRPSNASHHTLSAQTTQMSSSVASAESSVAFSLTDSVFDGGRASSISTHTSHDSWNQKWVPLIADRSAGTFYYFGCTPDY